MGGAISTFNGTFNREDSIGSVVSDDGDFASSRSIGSMSIDRLNMSVGSSEDNDSDTTGNRFNHIGNGGKGGHGDGGEGDGAESESEDVDWVDEHEDDGGFGLAVAMADAETFAKAERALSHSWDE